MMTVVADPERIQPGPFSRSLGFELVSADADGARIEATPGPDHANGGGIVHGGYLAALLDWHPGATHAAFSIARDGSMRRQSASCIANWFFRLYRDAGLEGCSSHSGRRTFATHIARGLGAFDGSIKDLQDLLGHACLSSTECYLEPSNRIDQLVRSLGT